MVVFLFRSPVDGLTRRDRESAKQPSPERESTDRFRRRTFIYNPLTRLLKSFVSLPLSLGNLEIFDCAEMSVSSRLFSFHSQLFFLGRRNDSGLFCPVLSMC